MAKDKDNKKAPTEQDVAKQKLIESGITDLVHLEIITDEYAGHGGSYIYDPITQKRTPA
jgi:hypothetical protein